MKPRWRPILTNVVVLLVFLIQLKRGFHPAPESGMIQTGAQPSTLAVVVPACFVRHFGRPPLVGSFCPMGSVEKALKLKGDA